MSSKHVPDQSESNGAPGLRKKAWSIAARLTAWYAASAFLLVVLSTGYLYWALVRNVNREDDELLADKVRAVQAILQRRPGDTSAIRHEVEDQWDSQRSEKTYVRILDEAGRVLVESPGISNILPSASFPAPAEGPGQGTDVGVRSGTVFRVMAIRHSDSRSPSIIHLAMDRSLEFELLEEYRSHLSYVLGVALIACIGIGYLIAHRGVRPLHEITATTRRIRPSNLGERLDHEGLPAELLTLAATFNDMLDRLEKSFNRISQFSADIAHELRTPLSSLRGEVEVALSKPRSGDEYREVFSSSLEECGRLERLIDRLLFLAKAENPEMQIDREPVDLGSELDAVREFYEPAAAEAGLNLTVTPHNSLHAELDRSLFQRSVGNLIANAIAHTSRGGNITLTVTESDQSTAVQVADTGCGIPEADLPHVFDRLYRVDPSRSSKHGSVGLGLAIVRSIVELHGGTIDISSAVGQGTHVEMTFPRVNGQIRRPHKGPLQAGEMTKL